jgi:hypothetical protein
MTRKNPGVDSKRPRRLRGIALAALSAIALSACLQTDPAGPGVDTDLERPPEDNGRRAGASSSTNWPAEFANRGYKAAWSFDSLLHIQFFIMLPDLPPTDAPVKLKGAIHLYPGKAIPAFDSVPPVSWSFPAADTLHIPLETIRKVSTGSSDTISFNVRLELDSLSGWVYGLQLDRNTGKLIETANSPFPATTTLLKSRPFFFQGLVSEVTSLLPNPAGNNPEISFYIPGTPFFCKAKADSFHVGPLPRSEYPLRVVRTSIAQGAPEGTLVEIWELRVAGLGESSVFTLGDQVLSYPSKGKLTLRD